MANQATGIFDYVSQSGKTFLGKGQQRPTPPKQSRPTVDPSVFSGKPTAGKPTAGDSGSGGLASRLIEAPIQTRSPEDMSITDGVASTQPQMITETQQPIEARGGSARYMIQGNGPKIDLSFLVPERANKAFDPSKAIGGENVPYKSAGFFRRALGDESNVQNIAAQLDQGAKWKKAAHEQLVEERVLARLAAADAPMQKRFDATQNENKIIRDADAATRLRERVEDASTRKGERGEDKAALLARETVAETTRLQERKDKLDQLLTENTLNADRLSLASRPNIQAVSSGDGVLLFDPTTGKPSGTYTKSTVKEVKDPITGEKKWEPSGGGFETYVPPVKAPVKDGSPGVDRATGATLGGPLPNTTPLGPENQNTAIGPRFMRGAGEVVTEGFQSLSDPLRAGATGLNKMLFDSNVQQDPEVIKRLKERARINALTPTRSAIPMGQ